MISFGAFGLQPKVPNSNASRRHELTMIVWMFGFTHFRLGGHRSTSLISWKFRVSKHLRNGFVTLDASQFKHLWEDVGQTALPYNGHPLAQLNGKRRGTLLQEWACKILQDTNPKALFEEAIPGTCVNGQRRNASQAEYDFLLDDRKGEVKSSQLQWEKSRWGVLFKGVKFPHLMSWDTSSFEDLYLVLFSPKWLHLVKHDLQTGISKAGLDPVGGRIHIAGSRNSLCWEESLQTILNKLCTQGGCSLIAKTEISESGILDMCNRHQGFGRQFYFRKPFSSMSPQLRGLRMQTIVWEIDKRLHSRSFFAHCSNEQTCSGRIRSQHNASVDWIRDGKRVEVKSAQLSFNKALRTWACVFSAIKLDCFDELLLAIYSPRGLDVFKHDGFFGLSTRGTVTETWGKSMSVCAPSGELDPIRALQFIEAKLEANNCPRIARIFWDDWPHRCGGNDLTMWFGPAGQRLHSTWCASSMTGNEWNGKPMLDKAFATWNSICYCIKVKRGLVRTCLEKFVCNDSMTIDYQGLFMWLGSDWLKSMSHDFFPTHKVFIGRQTLFSKYMC